MTEYQHDGRVYYACGRCGLTYTDKATAEECEIWCAQDKG
jgi:hypothetical protein